MKRNEFIQMCGLLGISLPFQSLLASCSTDDNAEGTPTDFNGKVLIIGAGAAGMTAGHLLAQQGIDFEILEAKDVPGGRMRHNPDFTDFPISLGGEWLHVERGVLTEIVNDASVTITQETTPYDLDVDYGIFASSGQRISLSQAGFTIDQKFVGSSWFGFFETYVLPSVQSHITYNTPIRAIDYSGEQVVVTDTEGTQYTADKLIVTIPVKILQNGSVDFTPALPAAKQEAINDIQVWNGCKAFIEFTEQFYPAFVAYMTNPETAGQKLYYDAAYGQNTNRPILGLFAVGVEADPYIQIEEDGALRDYMLAELDAVFGDNVASNAYVKHTFQNWNAEPYANGSYIVDHENWRLVRTLGEYVNDTLFFAGDGYTEGEDWSSVHAAARSAIRAVRAITG
ncbi:MAG: FAD-dependent oxidoreductase [Bacteroidota bacterium]